MNNLKSFVSDFSDRFASFNDEKKAKILSEFKLTANDVVWVLSLTDVKKINKPVGDFIEITVKNKHSSSLSFPCGKEIDSGKSGVISVFGGESHSLIKSWLKAGLISLPKSS